MRTFSAKTAEVEHRWFVVDADGLVLGRLASEVARVIRGKHKPTFTPHMDTGDNVIVINAAKVKVTGRKVEQKRYFRHTGYMGHERFTPLATVLAKHPERVDREGGLWHAAQDGARAPGAAAQAARIRRARSIRTSRSSPRRSSIAGTAGASRADRRSSRRHR